MQSKLILKVLVIVLIVSLWVMAVRGLNNADMTLEEAQTLIREQGNMQNIPSAVWKQLLTAEEFAILWEKGTEAPYSGALLEEQRSGTYMTKGCHIPVFRSEQKLASYSAWPSFGDVIDAANLVLEVDTSEKIPRTEVRSACGEHLGYLCGDDSDSSLSLPSRRYCINSLALQFIPDDEPRAHSNDAI